MLTSIQISLLDNKANGGDVFAQIELARIYKEGRGVTPSFSKTLKYYSMAARKDHPEALFFIAECQDKGKGMTLSPEYAFQNYLKAAKKGHIEATLAIGHFYEIGRAAHKNLAKAKEFYEIAMSKGSLEAKESLKRIALKKDTPLSGISPLEMIKRQQERLKRG
jgi:TPR repeat protein